MNAILRQSKIDDGGYEACTKPLKHHLQGVAILRCR